MQKMQYTLLRENHIIEKALSIKDTKKGFGVAKITNLCKRLKIYDDRYGLIDPDFLTYPLVTIKKYISHTKDTSDVNIEEIEAIYNELSVKYLTSPVQIFGGIEICSSDNIINKAKGDFKDLIYSRHSVRYFTADLPSDSIISKALALASRTPSACNRQGWKTHVYKGSICHKLLKWQGGANGFEQDVHCAILVTADLRAFLEYEVFQAYVDGGLYAMNLINALHFQGLGTIPLSCGFNGKKLDELKHFNVPENEVPILIIGTGYYPNEFKVAISTRKPVERTNNFEK
ncbi:MAG: nitroreductase family protein [Muribaculaceae bacterium]|nr:nitroreductase family protein [Muribaculaceae bacterium]